FNTNEPEQLLQLFIAVATGVIAPKELENDPNYTSAQFCIENKEKVKSEQQEKDMSEIKTMGVFYGMLKNPKKLSLVLNYVGVKPPSNFDESLVTSQFKRWVENKNDKYQNRELFLEAAEKADDKEGYQELSYYKVLQDLYRKGVIKKEYEKYLLDGEELGTSSLKTCAENIIKDKGLQSKLMDHIKE